MTLKLSPLTHVLIAVCFVNWFARNIVATPSKQAPARQYLHYNAEGTCSYKTMDPGFICSALDQNPTKPQTRTADDRRMAEAQADTAQEYFDKRDYDHAISFYLMSIESLPTTKAYAGLGASYSKLKKYAEALRAFKKLNEMLPNNSDVHVLLAKAYKGLGGQQLEAGASGLSAFKSEEDEGREAIRLDPKNQPAYLHVGGALVVQLKFAEALAPLQQAVRLKPDDKESLLVLGYDYAKLGNKDEAKQIYTRLEALDKGYAQQLLTEINKQNREN